MNAILATFESRARRVETPCGDGVMVWRAWGSGPPVMLAHGSHGAWSHWVRNIDALCAGRTLWVPDLPGYGESALPPEQDHSTYTAVIAAGLRQILGRSDLPLDVVGFSFGGVMSGYLAASHPELVRRLILVGTGGLDTPVGHIALRRLKGLDAEGRRAAHRDNLLELMLHDPTSVDDLALHIHEINGSRARLDPIPLVLPDKLMAALPRISVQLDAIWGEKDRPHYNPAAQEATLRRFQADLDFRVIGNAGHWAMYEQPEPFNRTLLELLEQPLRLRTSQ